MVGTDDTTVVDEEPQVWSGLSMLAAVELEILAIEVVEAGQARVELASDGTAVAVGRMR